MHPRKQHFPIRMFNNTHTIVLLAYKDTPLDFLQLGRFIKTKININHRIVCHSICFKCFIQFAI